MQKAGQEWPRLREQDALESKQQELNLGHIESILKSGITEIELSDDETIGGRLPERLTQMEHLVKEMAVL